MYMLRGDLPWQGLEAGSKAESFKRILECKLNTPLDELCKGFPAEFEQYLKYCRNLRFEESPDYVWMKNLFKNLYFRENPVFDNAWDWSYIDVPCTDQNRLYYREDTPNSSLPGPSKLSKN